MIICVGSTNQVKVEAVKKIASELMPDAEVNCVNTPSNVSEMPMSDEETISGAVNRAREALKYSGADYGVGIEGGVDDNENGMFLCAWVAVLSKDGIRGLACTGKIQLPIRIADGIRSGRELGPLMDELTGRNDVKHAEGTYGILTMGKISRSKSFEEAITSAFMKFINKEWY